MKTATVLTWGRTEPMTCPRCRVVLRSATAIADERSHGPGSGDITLCDRCCTWLVFERRAFPSALGLRLATVEEIAAIDPGRRALAERIAGELASVEPKH